MRNRATNLAPQLLAAWACVLLCALVSARAQAPAVLKVEPPSWWAGHSLNPVRLLLRGRNLHGASVTSERPELEAFGAVANAAGTYAFVNVRVAAGARPGEYALTLKTPSGRASVPFRLNAPLDPAKNFQGITNDDVIYLIMPDRFADGDPSNNSPKDSPPEANDRKNPRAWHGGGLRGVINRLPYLKELGVTALWLNPWYDNWNGVNRCDKPWCPNTYYHGYHTVDYYGVEDRFGTMETLRELVERAHSLGLKVIQDQVANHVVTHHPWASDPPLENWFHGTVRSHTLNNFRSDLLHSPHAGAWARRPLLDGWFSDEMPDMNQEEAEVARYEIQNALWWVGMTGVDGIRQDTVQFMPRPFIRDLNAALDREYPRMWMVGEAWNTEPMHTSFYIGGRAGWDGVDTLLDSVFDFPLWDTSVRVFTGKAPTSALRDVLRADVVYQDPSRLTTFANNHDVQRFMSAEGATVEGMMMHVAFTLSARGTPQLYYGEEIAMEGKGDPDNRRDFPGGFPGDARDAFTERGRTPAEQRMFEWTRSWISLRHQHPALRRGVLIDLFYDDDAYVFARREGYDNVIIAINRAASMKDVSFPLEAIAADGQGLLAPVLMSRYIFGEEARIEGGAITLRIPPRTAVPFLFLAGSARHVNKSR